MSAQTEQLEPLSQDLDSDDDSWIDDDNEWCDHCDGDISGDAACIHIRLD